MTDINNRPPDWAEDWGKIEYSPMVERAAFAIATGGPVGMIPRAPGQQASAPPRTSTGNRETPIASPPGINLVDAICVAADQREWAQAAAPDMMAQMAQVMTMVMQQQSQMLQALALLVLRDDDDKPKRKPKSPSAEGEA